MPTWAWILIIAVIAALAIAMSVLARKSRKDDEKQREREREKISQTLSQHTFVVVIRERDDRKVDFESIFIDQLIDCGGNVKTLKPGDEKKLLIGDFSTVPEGAYALVGRAWVDSGKQHFDYRLITSKDEIILAGNVEDYNIADYSFDNPMIPRIIKQISATLEKKVKEPCT